MSALTAQQLQETAPKRIEKTNLGEINQQQVATGIEANQEQQQQQQHLDLIVEPRETRSSFRIRQQRQQQPQTTKTDQLASWTTNNNRAASRNETKSSSTLLSVARPLLSGQSQQQQLNMSDPNPQQSHNNNNNHNHNSKKSPGNSTAPTTKLMDPQQMHVCRLCDKLLSSSSSLDRHMLTHSGERPFVCKRCHMTFTTNGK